MDLAEYERIQPHATVDGLKFFTPNTHCAWRVQTLYTKEPDTINWINGMPSDAVLYDVGANMGQYSLYAAKRGIRVFAFEPDSQNFALLIRNLALNGAENVHAWPIALGAKHADFNDFFVTQLLPGSSCHAFGDPIAYNGEPKQFALKHGSVGSTLDWFHTNMRPPTHIKIDVDGFEDRVLAGGHNTLHYIDSLLVEINTHLSSHRAIFSLMHEYGFEYDQTQADSSRRKEGPFEGVGNVIFYRD